MQPTEETLQHLSRCFLESLSPAPEPRKNAEAILKQAADQPGYGITVLKLLTISSLDQQILQSAAVNFKNHVKYRWNPSDEDMEKFGEVKPIQEQEKEEIKIHIVDLMLTSQSRVQFQLSDALAIISSHDFPEKWPTLLPSLVTKLETLDTKICIGVLHTANSIFKRFREQYKSNQLYIQLKYCLDNFALPILKIFQEIGTRVVSADQSVDAETLKSLVEVLRLVARVFYSLNYQEIPEVFEDHIKQWMLQFHVLLNYNSPLLVEKEDKESILDSLKAAICENINLYMEKYEEEFQNYLPGFVKAVWDLLMHVGKGSNHDHLAITAIRFLTTVSVSVHHALFGEQTTLQLICEGIVLPNLAFREEDEELFDMNYLEYIRRDMEGSDGDTRRRTACELVKGLSTHFQAQITAIFSQHVAAMLTKYASNPDENWKEKDSAIFLVIALAVRQKSLSEGATEINELVSIGDFISSQILPELTAADINERPVLKADALKFLTTFRSQISKAAALQVMPSVIRFLAAESNVVHSYAANCIERFLMVKDGQSKRFSGADIEPIKEPLITSLFGALKLPDSAENQYVMKCIMRVLHLCDISTLAPLAMNELVQIVTVVYTNPKYPTFNHYVFESVATLLKKADHPSMAVHIPAFESSLFPVVQIILTQDVAEFVPYCFQLLALLVEVRPPPLPPMYLGLFPPLLSPALWEKSANAPALVRLMQSYLEKAPNELVANNQISPVLGVFQKMIISKHTDHHGFAILKAVIQNLSLEALSPFLKQIWILLFHRLQSSKTAKYSRGLLVFFSDFVVKHSLSTLVQSINTVQDGIFGQLLASIWIPTLPTITDNIESKLCAIISTQILVEYSQLQSDPALDTWSKLLDSVLTLVGTPAVERAADIEEEKIGQDDEETVPGYTAVFSQLYSAGKKDLDPFPTIRDSGEYLVNAVGQLSRQTPGKYTAAISSKLSPANVEAFKDLRSKYGVHVV